MSNPPDPCNMSHDFENVTCPSRALFICPRCKTDISLEYLFWAQAAHPEWFEEKKMAKGE